LDVRKPEHLNMLVSVANKRGIRISQPRAVCTVSNGWLLFVGRNHGMGSLSHPWAPIFVPPLIGPWASVA